VLRHTCTGLTAAVVTMACALGIAPSASAAALTAVTVGATASYEANGAGVLLPMTVTCKRGAQISFSTLSLSQRIPHSSLVNHASGDSASPLCSGGAQRIYALLSSDTATALLVGSAAVQVGVYTCSPTSCGEDLQTLSRVVQVKTIDFASETMRRPRLDVNLSTTAAVVARGAGMRVSATMRCTGTAKGNSSATVRQLNVDGVQAQGADGPVVACDGEYHRVSFVVPAANRVWHKGQALVALHFSACFPTHICGDVLGADTVTVV
jgi:hypothetical protein